MTARARVLDDNPVDLQGDEFGLSLLCRAQKRWCAIPLRYVIETMRPLPTAPIPGAPAFIDGLAIIRGEPVPVVDLSRLLGDAPMQPTRLVCLRTNRGVIALAVEEVQGLRLIVPESLHSLPPLLQGAKSEIVATIGMLDAELLLILQTARLVPEDLWAIIPRETASA